MATLEHLDAILGEALENIEEAAAEVRALTSVSNEAAIRSFGMAIMALWDVRDLVYQQRPDLKMDIVKEIKDNIGRCEALIHLNTEASRLEAAGDRQKAILLFDKLLKTAKFGHFRRLAEAGLYRCYLEVKT